MGVHLRDPSSKNLPTLAARVLLVEFGLQPPQNLDITAHSSYELIWERSPCLVGQPTIAFDGCVVGAGVRASA